MNAYDGGRLTLTAIPERATRTRAVGPVFFLVLAQLIFYLIALNGSTIIPGDWSGFTALMLAYIALTSIAIGVFAQNLSIPLVREGDTGKFLKVASAATAVSIGLTVLYIQFLGGGEPTLVSGTVRFQELVVVGLFIGPAEELLFRVVLPPLVAKTYAWQLVLSSILFAIFHIGAYTAAGVAWNPETLASQLIQVGLLGAAFFFIDWKSTDPKTGALRARFGWGGGLGGHIGYDWAVLGVVGGLSIGAHGLGLVSL